MFKKLILFRWSNEIIFVGLMFRIIFLKLFSKNKNNNRIISIIPARFTIGKGGS